MLPNWLRRQQASAAAAESDFPSASMLKMPPCSHQRQNRGCGRRIILYLIMLLSPWSSLQCGCRTVSPSAELTTDCNMLSSSVAWPLSMTSSSCLTAESLLGQNMRKYPALSVSFHLCLFRDQSRAVVFSRRPPIVYRVSTWIVGGGKRSFVGSLGFSQAD